jgi:N,N'-diacetylchitobiose phosphorylase
VKRRWRGATFAITVKNPNGVQTGVTTVTLNGKMVRVTGGFAIRPQESGTVNEVVVVMG